MENNCGIYCIKNNVTGMAYVGQTISFERRFCEHEKTLERGIHKNIHLQNSWNIHGKNSFSFCVLEVCRNDELNKKETFYIKELQTFHPKGYNLLIKDDKTIMSEYTRKRMSDIAIKRFSLPINHPMYGKKHSVKSIEKNRESNKNRQLKKEWVEKLRKNIPRGEKSPSAKLTSSDVLEIRDLLLVMKNAEIAEKYGVSPATIWKIRTRRSWQI